MARPLSKSSIWKKTIKNDTWLIAVLLSGVALFATGIVPYFQEVDDKKYEKLIAAVRWGAVGLFYSAIVAIFTKFASLDEKLERVNMLLESERLIELPSSAEYLDTLRRSMKEAKKRIFLMYFVEDPPDDLSTRQYWQSFVQLLAKKADEPLEFRRIATIGTEQKLKSVLSNNRALFDNARNIPCTRINYKLVYYPNPEIKPPQADIVDDAVFLFSPYSDGGSHGRIWTSNQALVENFAKYYEGLWYFLKSRGHLIFDFPNRKERVYHDSEVLKLMSIARAVQVQNEQKIFEEYIRPYTSLEFETVIEKLKNHPQATSL
jgi:hypothetical protein